MPLNALALAELGKLKSQKRGLLFTTTGKTSVSGFSDAKERLDGFALGIMRDRAVARDEDPENAVFPHWRFHDLRRSGTTSLQQLGIPIEVTEATMNHISGKTAGIAGVYNLYKYEAEKRRALELWGDRLIRLISGTVVAANAVPLQQLGSIAG